MAAATKLSCKSASLDGEVIIQDELGRSDFQGLRSAIGGRPHDLVFLAFDLLHLDGRDLRRLPIEERRMHLEELIGEPDPSSPIHYSQHITGQAREVFASAERMGLEGIVCKRLGSRYRSGASRDWLKIKSFMEEELVVTGTEQGKRAPVALLARETDSGLKYAGGAMITLPQVERDKFWVAVEELEVSTPSIPIKPRKGARWVRPEMHVVVRTLRGEEMLRHATILRVL